MDAFAQRIIKLLLLHYIYANHTPLSS